MSEQRVNYTFEEDRHRTQCVCRDCGLTGFTESRHHFAVHDFRAAGWQMVPTRLDGTPGYWLCPSCADSLKAALAKRGER